MSRSIEDGIVTHHSETASNLSMLLVIVALIVAAIAGGLNQSVVTTAQPRSAAHTEDSFSLFDLPGTWRDQTGASRALRSVGRSPMVLALVYTDCAAACPLVVTTMQRIEARSDSDVRFVLVTLNPDRDTPGALSHYASAHGLSRRWTLLTGTDGNVRALAVALGIRYARVSPTELSHSNTFAVIDSDGSVVMQFAGAGAVDEATAVLASLTRGKRS